MSGRAETIRREPFLIRVARDTDGSYARELIERWDALLAENQRWHELAVRQLEEFTVTTQEYRAEIQRLREALEWYADSPSPGLRERAEKALAGATE